MAEKVFLKHQKVIQSGSISLSMVGVGNTLQLQIESTESLLEGDIDIDTKQARLLIAKIEEWIKAKELTR